MRKLFIPLTAAAIMAGTTAGADPFVDAVVRNFQSMGYEFIEIDRGRTQLRAEGVRGSEELTVIYDLATGSIVRQVTGRADDWYIGRSGVEINSRDRDFVGDDRSGRGRDDFDDDDDDDDRSRGRDDFDDDDDDDDRSRGRDDNDDNDDDDDDDDRSFSGSDSGSGSGRDDNDDDNDDDDDDD